MHGQASRISGETIISLITSHSQLGKTVEDTSPHVPHSLPRAWRNISGSGQELWAAFLARPRQWLACTHMRTGISMLQTSLAANGGQDSAADARQDAVQDGRLGTVGLLDASMRVLAC